MYILAPFFLEKDDKCVFKARNSCACKEFLANKTDDYLYLYIRNLEILRLKPIFRYTISICICLSW